MSRTVLLNAAFVASRDARISVYNGGWLHGAGLFETMRVEDKHVFRLEEHMARLRASAETLLVPIDRSDLPDADAWRRLLELNGLTDARARLTVTAGDMLDTQNGEERPLTVCGTVSPLSPYSKELYKTGTAVVVSKYRQASTDPLAGHKTTNYLARLMALNAANRSGCGESLWFTPTNLLAEGSISNVFAVKDNVVTTPPVDTPVLPGIARSLVLEICAAKKIMTEQTSVNIDQLLDADEVFLTNSIMQVLPVCRVEKHNIGTGRPGAVANRLLALYRERIARECEANA